MDTKKMLNGLLSTLVAGMVLFWAVGAMANGDPLWFSRAFSDDVVAVSLYADGEVVTLTEDDPGFEALASSFAMAMGNWKAYESQVVLSEESLSRYYEEGLLLEVNYAAPVQLHTRHSFPEARTYLVPLSGTHSNYNRVFGFQHTVPWASGCVNLEPEFATQLHDTAKQVLNYE